MTLSSSNTRYLYMPPISRDMRFTVGYPNGPESCIWKFWTSGDEAYLLQKGPLSKVQKYSFHSTGYCALAEIDKTRKGTDRAITSWRREDFDDSASASVKMLTLVIPTAHLSHVKANIDKKRLTWIEPAPKGHSIVLECGLSKSPDRHTLLKQFSEAKRLLFFSPLRTAYAAYMAVSIEACESVGFRVPAAAFKARGEIPHAFGDIVFPLEDVTNSGRPVRMTVHQPHVMPPVVWEFGGYQV